MPRADSISVLASDLGNSSERRLPVFFKRSIYHSTQSGFSTGTLLKTFLGRSLFTWLEMGLKMFM